MKRITITLPDPIANHANDWADQQDRPTANLLAYLVETDINEAIESGKFRPRPDYNSDEKGFKFRSKAEERMLKQVGLALKALADGEPLPKDVCVTDLAELLGIDSDTLLKLWSRTNGNAKTI